MGVRTLWILGLAVAIGGTQAGCSFKLGAQQFQDPLGDGRSRTRLRVEGEVASPRIFGGHLEGTAAIGFAGLQSSDETLRVREEDKSISNLPVSSTTVMDVRLGARLYPFASGRTDWFGHGVQIEPYLVGGGGYYWMTATQRGAGRKLCCGDYELVEESDTVADGLFPYLGVGIKARFEGEWSAFVEIRQDFDRLDNGRDTSGTSAMIGLRWGF